MTHSIKKTEDKKVGIYSTNVNNFIFEEKDFLELYKTYKAYQMKQLEQQFEEMWKRMLKRFFNDKD